MRYKMESATSFFILTLLTTTVGKNLHYTGHNLTHVPIDSITPDAYKVSLSDNKISHLGSFKTTPYIRHLFIANNRVNNLSPQTFRRLGELRVLDLNRNFIVFLRDFVFFDLAALLDLFLSNNLISAISERAFHGLASLEFLELSGNRLSVVPMQAIRLIPSKQLLLVLLMVNNISHIPRDIKSAHPSASYQFQGNPLRCPDGQVSRDDVFNVDIMEKWPIITPYTINTEHNRSFVGKSFLARSGRRHTANKTLVVEDFSAEDSGMYTSEMGMPGSTMSYRFDLLLCLTNRPNEKQEQNTTMSPPFDNISSPDTAAGRRTLTSERANSAARAASFCEADANETETVITDLYGQPTDYAAMSHELTRTASHESVADLGVLCDWSGAATMDCAGSVSGSSVAGEVQSVTLSPSQRDITVMILVIADHNVGTLNTGDTTAVSKIPCGTECSVWLVNCNITTIEVGAFAKLPQVKTLVIWRSDLQTLKHGVFEGMEGLEDLALLENNITCLEAGAFDGLPLLWSLLLVDNQILTIAPGTLRRLQLSWLDVVWEYFRCVIVKLCPIARDNSSQQPLGVRAITACSNWPVGDHDRSDESVISPYAEGRFDDHDSLDESESVISPYAEGRFADHDSLRGTDSSVSSDVVPYGQAALCAAYVKRDRSSYENTSAGNSNVSDQNCYNHLSIPPNLGAAQSSAYQQRSSYENTSAGNTSMSDQNCYQHPSILPNPGAAQSSAYQQRSSYENTSAGNSNMSDQNCYQHPSILPNPGATQSSAYQQRSSYENTSARNSNTSDQNCYQHPSILPNPGATQSSAYQQRSSYENTSAGNTSMSDQNCYKHPSILPSPGATQSSAYQQRSSYENTSAGNTSMSDQNCYKHPSILPNPGATQSSAYQQRSSYENTSAGNTSMSDQNCYQHPSILPNPGATQSSAYQQSDDPIPAAQSYRDSPCYNSAAVAPDVERTLPNTYVQHDPKVKQSSAPQNPP
ncbi:SLIT1 [Branchiostoma lanceolatum]|uniref:SLIT1 protein n=1 Tax=Branchiostoma lanceolatum TaxID=7740 RepID=A0A8J9ZSL1_BRALA|nr:SLIT1 [Branchiostoma lanceolatum]